LADAAYAQAIRASLIDPELLRAADALVAGRLAGAERILRARLKRAPTGVAAIRMLAELARRLGRYVHAEKLLARALDLAPASAPRATIMRWCCTGRTAPTRRSTSLTCCCSTIRTIPALPT
jgi:tetratricopeptide (TPR) repeat protein